jgi:hypothetical protein
MERSLDRTAYSFAPYAPEKLVEDSIGTRDPPVS